VHIDIEYMFDVMLKVDNDMVGAILVLRVRNRHTALTGIPLHSNVLAQLHIRLH